MHSCCTHLLKESKYLVNHSSQDGLICCKGKCLIPTEWVNWLSKLICQNNYSYRVLPIYWIEPILYISILKMMRRPACGYPKSPTNIFPKLLTLTKRNWVKLLGRSDNRIVVKWGYRNWLAFVSVACLKIRFFSPPKLIICKPTIRDVKNVCTHTRLYIYNIQT